MPPPRPKRTPTLYVAGNDRQFTITALFDNLGKGSGAAVQAINLMLGLEETAGLSLDPCRVPKEGRAPSRITGGSIMKFIDGGICAAQGFRAAGIHVGVKTHAAWKKDVALIVSDTVCTAAGSLPKTW